MSQPCRRRHPPRPQQRHANLYTDLLTTVRELGLLTRGAGTTSSGSAWCWSPSRRRRRRPARQLLVPVPDRRRLRARPGPGRIPQPRQRAPADLPLGRLERLDGTHPGQRNRRDEHHLVAQQALQAPHAPNQIGKDPDVDLGVVAFTPDAVAKRGPVGQWFAARQGWLFFPLLTLEGVSLHVSSLQHLFRRGASRVERVEAAVVVSRIGVYVTALYVLLPVGKASAFLGIQLAVFGVCLGASFAPNHKGMPLVPGDDEARLPAPPGADVAQHPRRPADRLRDGRPELPDRAPPVPEHAPAEPAPGPADRSRVLRTPRHQYTEVGLFASYKIVVDYLNNVGLKARDPFQCPLATQLRNSGPEPPTRSDSPGGLRAGAGRGSVELWAAHSRRRCSTDPGGVSTDALRTGAFSCPSLSRTITRSGPPAAVRQPLHRPNPEPSATSACSGAGTATTGPASASWSFRHSQAIWVGFGLLGNSWLQLLLAGALGAGAHTGRVPQP